MGWRIEKPSTSTVVTIVALAGLLAFSVAMIWRGFVSDPGARAEGGRHQQLRHWRCTKCGREFALTANEHGKQTRDAADFTGSRALCPDREEKDCGRWSAVFVAKPVKDAPPDDDGSRRPPAGSSE